MRTFFFRLSKEDPQFLSFILALPSIEQDLSLLDRLWEEYQSVDLAEKKEKQSGKGQKVLVLEKYLLSESVPVLALSVWLAHKEPSPFYLSYLMRYISYSIEAIKKKVREAIVLQGNAALGVVSEVIVNLGGAKKVDALIILKELIKKKPQYQNVNFLTQLMKDESELLAVRLAVIDVLAVIEGEKAVSLLFSTLTDMSWEVAEKAHQQLKKKEDVLGGLVWNKIKESRSVQEKSWLLRVLSEKIINNKVQVELMDAYRSEEDVFLKRELLYVLATCQEMSVSHFIYHAWEKEKKQEEKEFLYELLMMRVPSLVSMIQSQVKEKKNTEKKVKLVCLFKFVKKFDPSILKLVESLLIEASSLLEYRLILVEVASNLIGCLSLGERGRYKETQAFFLKEIFFISKQIDSVDQILRLMVLLKNFTEPVLKDVISQFVTEKLINLEYIKDREGQKENVIEGLLSLTEYLEQSSCLKDQKNNKAFFVSLHRLCFQYKEDQRLNGVYLRWIKSVSGFLSFLEGEALVKKKQKRLFSPQEKEWVRFSLSILVSVKEVSSKFLSDLKKLLTSKEESMTIKEEFIPLLETNLKKEYWDVVKALVESPESKVNVFGKSVWKERVEKVGVTLNWPENSHVRIEE